MTITKSITLDATGTFGSILSSGVNAINISIAVNANDPLRQVTIRGLSINGTGSSGTVGTRTGLNGINVSNTGNGAATIHVEDTLIQNFSQNGILVNAPPGTTHLILRNVTIRSCGVAGINTNASGGNQTAFGFDNINVSECPMVSRLRTAAAAASAAAPSR